MSVAHAARMYAADETVSETCIMTFTGLYVEPLELDAALIRIEDVAHHLSNLCRYTGAVRRFYSVAEHSVRCAEELERRGHDKATAFHGLLHDAQEAYLIDIPRPLKSDPYFGKTYRGAEARCERAVAEAFDLGRMPDAVRDMDLILLATERRDLLPSNGRWSILEGVEPIKERIEPWTPLKAERRFLSTFKRLEAYKEGAPE